MKKHLTREQIEHLYHAIDEIHLHLRVRFYKR